MNAAGDFWAMQVPTVWDLGQILNPASLPPTGSKPEDATSVALLAPPTVRNPGQHVLLADHQQIGLIAVITRSTFQVSYITPGTSEYPREMG